jgi:hypothetical protein
VLQKNKRAGEIDNCRTCWHEVLVTTHFSVRSGGRRSGGGGGFCAWARVAFTSAHSLCHCCRSAAGSFASGLGSRTPDRRRQKRSSEHQDDWENAR